MEPDARALGTAAHAALEFIFGNENSSAENAFARLTECFLRALGGADDHPDVKRTLERVLALVRSPWGEKILALKADARSVERPFRWRIRFDGAQSAALTLAGQIDLLAYEDSGRCQLIDFKLSASEKNDSGA